MRLNLIYFLTLALLMGCKNYEPNQIQWLGDSSKLIADGISVSFDENNITLEFSCTINETLSAHSEAEWINTDIQSYDNKGTITIFISKNDSDIEREGLILISFEDIHQVIKVRQSAKPSAEIGIKSLKVGAAGGEVLFKVKANGDLKVDSYWRNGDWAKVSRISIDMDGYYYVYILTKENTGLGRIAGFTLSVDGVSVDQKLNIIQHPAQFSKKVNVNLDEIDDLTFLYKGGALPILLGDDMENLHRIRELSIYGPINMIDLSYLKKLGISDVYKAEIYPLSFDVQECGIWSNSINPFEKIGWDPSSYTGEEITVNEELPMGYFSNWNNLISIKLPKNLKYIGRRGLYGCSNLKTISLPNSVENIGAEAFYYCSSLEDINISKESNLTTIGSQAFATGTILQSLTIPECCIYINSQAFLGCKTKELHLNWTVDPIELAIVPDPNICTLYIPKGTSDLYRSTPNWFKYTKIIEE